MHLQNLVGSIHHWAPRVKVIFYDLGLSRVQAEDVGTWEDVELRKFDFKQYGAHLHVDENKTRNGVQVPMEVVCGGRCVCCVLVNMQV